MQIWDDGCLLQRTYVSRIGCCHIVSDLVCKLQLIWTFSNVYFLIFLLSPTSNFVACLKLEMLCMILNRQQHWKCRMVVLDKGFLEGQIFWSHVFVLSGNVKRGSLCGLLVLGFFLATSVLSQSFYNASHMTFYSSATIGIFVTNLILGLFEGEYIV